MADNVSIAITENKDEVTINVTEEKVSISVTENKDEVSVFVDSEVIFTSDTAKIYAWPQPTGQTTIYRTGDDAWVQQNIFNALPTSGKIVTLTDFLTLAENNIFGNTNRFTDENGAQTYAADYVIDNFTGLGWKRTFEAAAIWDTAIDNALAKTFAGFTDWFLPSMSHMLSIDNMGTIAPLNYAPFNLSPATSRRVLTGTTNPVGTERSAFLYYETAAPSVQGALNMEEKNIVAYQYLICRKHF